MDKKLNQFPYKIHICQPFKPQDLQRRFEIANAMIIKLEDGKVDPHKIWFLNPAHFQLTKYVNKNNMQNWDTENPHFALSKSHSFECAVR